MANEYISKQRAKDLMGCCLASAKANYKEETNIFKREKFQCYVETIEAMIDVVGAVEVADVQPVKHGKWVLFDKDCVGRAFYCSNCRKVTTTDDFESSPLERDEYFCSRCGARMIKDGEQK